MIPKTVIIKEEAAPPTWQTLPAALRQRVITQLVKLLLKQISRQEVSDDPSSQDQ